MTERKWTSGPWGVGEYNQLSDEIEITAEAGFYVSSIDCDGVYDADGGEGSIMIANAHLIAAAPDLYEALEYMMVCHRDIHDKECERALSMTKAALAKARGKLK